MSQEKVERYKKEKANRKQTMKKDKAKSIAATYSRCDRLHCLNWLDRLFRIFKMGSKTACKNNNSIYRCSFRLLR